jgi:hypothetical protein
VNLTSICTHIEVSRNARQTTRDLTIKLNSFPETAREPVGDRTAGSAGASGGGEGALAASEGSGYHHQQEDGGSDYCQLDRTS